MGQFTVYRVYRSSQICDHLRVEIITCSTHLVGPNDRTSALICSNYNNYISYVCLGLELMVKLLVNWKPITIIGPFEFSWLRSSN